MIFLLTFFLLSASIQEKIGQLLMVHFRGEEVNEEAKVLIQDLHVGGIIYYNWANGLHSPEQVKHLSAGLRELAPTPLLIAIDQEGGRVARLKEGFTLFEGNGAIASAERAHEVGFTIGRELKEVGINLNLAPVVDVLSDPKSPIGSRSFGSDPLVVTRFAGAMIDGFHEGGVLAALKHFPGLGGVKVDSHFDLPVLEEVGEGMVPFMALKGVADVIMTAHILIPSLDPLHCATLSPTILQLLAPFEGVIMSDSLLMEGVIREAGTVEEAAILALKAGCDILLIGGEEPFDMGRVHLALVEAVRSGRIPEDRVDAAYRKVQRLKDSI